MRLERRAEPLGQLETAFEIGLGDPLLSQALEDQADLASATDEPDVGGRCGGQVLERLLVVSVPPGHDQGVGLGRDLDVHRAGGGARGG